MSRHENPYWEPFALFTRSARYSMVLAQREARSLDHGHFGTEHLLLGLLGIEEGVAYRALSALGVSLEDARNRIRDTGVQENVREGSGPSATGQLPFTRGMKKVLSGTVSEARRLGHDKHIGTEHLLLGLVGQRGSVAATVLDDRGAAPEEVRREVIRQIGKAGR